MILIDTVGLVVLATLVAGMSLFFPGSEIPGVLWAFIYVMWAVCALFIWHHPKAPVRPMKWMMLALLSVLGAPLWFGFAALASRLFFANNEPPLSSTYDLAVAFMLTPGVTFIALIGWMRALIFARKSQA